MSNVFQLPNEFAGVSISHATMRDIDVLTAIVDFMDSNSHLARVEGKPNLRMNWDQSSARKESTEALELLQAEEEGKIQITGEAENISFLINEVLFMLLNEIAPDNHYFGSRPEDGSDFGFWRFEEEEDFIDE